MKTRNVVVSAILVTASAAQINLNSIFSDVQSVYTAVTSALGGSPSSITSTSASTTSSSSSSTTTTSSSTSETSTSSLTSASSGSAASTPTNSAAARSSAAAAATSTGNGGGSNSNTLPIVLGCTLGALALAAFLALFFICRRRSKRSKAVANRHDLVTSDDESDVWNREKYHRNSFKGPTERTRALGTRNNLAAAPLMSQHGPGNQHAVYEPDTRQSAYGPAPPTRQFPLTDDPRENEMTSYTAHPYSPDHVQSYRYNAETPADSHRGREALAAGVGGAALGGLATHTTDRHEARRSDSRSRKLNGVDRTYTEDEQNILPEVTAGSAHRSSGSVSRASVKEPWPFMDAHERRSNDSDRSRPRSFSRGRGQSGMHEQESHNMHSTPPGTAFNGKATGGGLVGAATAHAAGSRSPHRKGILKQTSKPASTSIPPDSNNAVKPTTIRSSGPHELESFEVPPPPVTTGRERRYSPLGTAAPVGAIGANRSPTRSHRRSWSNSSTPTNARPTSMLHDSSQESGIPVVPSRSPRRNSVHSNARYSTANEGTVELPGPDEGQVGATNREFVSPALEPHRASMDNDAVVSPISPDTSLPGTWSKAQAEELGMNSAELAARSSSQESTATSYSPLNSNSTASSSSTEHSSGLVSAIQRIFNSQKQSWPVEEPPTVAPPRRSFGDRAMPVSENIYEDGHPTSSVPHRKPAPAMTAQYRGPHDEINTNDVRTTTIPGGWTNETTSLRQTDSRKSMESARSIPADGGRFYAPANSVDEDKTTTAAAVPITSPGANTSMNTGRTRSTSRPGYGIVSGDPFDLASIRTDSSTTGISLPNYTEPTRNTASDTGKNTNATNTVAVPQPHAYHTSKPSHEYREPTLAELRREVEEEDRQRRMSWKSNSRRSNTSRKSMEGQRYGNDNELFDLAFPGSKQYDHFYGQEQQHPGSGVGTAY